MPLKTPLYDLHRAAGARIVEFAGWLMPVQYSGIIDEHRTVRSALGVFDVSHMGEVTFEGPRALEALQRVVTADVGRLADGDAAYTVICREHGGIVDDCLIYRRDAEHFFTVVNAANEEKDFAWFAEHAGSIAEVRNRSSDYALIAVQGPRAAACLDTLTPLDLTTVRPFTFVDGELAGCRVTAARTGYTGEDGFELFVGPKDAPQVWSAVLEAGQPSGGKPVGLGARDTLRLEARLCLYGNDITDETTPLEAGLGWVVKLDAGDFIGREALRQQKAEGLSRRLVGFVMKSRAVARHDYPILLPGESPDQPGPRVGTVTSGTTSPTLGYGIGMGYVTKGHTKPGQQLVIDCRGKPGVAEIVKGPFHKRSA